MSFPRYERYKDSGVEWLGEVPEGWEVKPIKAVSTCNDEVLGDSTPSDYEINYVEISGVDSDRGIIEAITVPFGTAPSRARRRVNDGDVIVSTVRTYLRAIAPVIKPPENMVVSTGFAVIRPRSIHPNFLRYLFSSEFLISEVIARSVGVSYPAINASDLIRLNAAMPPLSEQQTIADFLDHETGKIDELVAEQEGLISLLKEKRQALITHAVTKGLNPNVEMKDSEVDWIGEMPEHWVISRLGHFASIENGTTPSRDNELFWREGTIPWLGSGEVNQIHVTVAQEFITETALRSCSLRLLPIGTVIVGMIGQGKTRGMAAILGIEATINQNLAAICVGPKLRATFLLHLFHASYEWIREAGRGSNQSALNCEILGEFSIALPPLAEQDEIIEVISLRNFRIDLLLDKTKRSIVLLKERRSALISAAVTGKIDVRGLA